MGRLVPIYEIGTSHLPSQNCILSKWCGLTFNVTYFTIILAPGWHIISYIYVVPDTISKSVSLASSNPRLLFLILLINQLGQTSSKPLNVFRKFFSAHFKKNSASLFLNRRDETHSLYTCSCVT